MAPLHEPNGHQTVDFGPLTLALDCAAEADRIESFLARTISRRLNRRGVVVGVSGGVDSAACATLAVRTLGPDRVFVLLMPERESSEDATARGKELCRQLGVTFAVEDISPTLDAIGCYRRRDEAIRKIFPEYGPGWRQKITIAGSLQSNRVVYFNLVVESPIGIQFVRRMPSDVYLQVVAATNFKQRVRKNIEYYHAERLNFAVLGTPNRLEYELGFFVRGGDGLADIKPIAHLYKSQVYALARYLGIPSSICNQQPSTDTYSLQQSQEEFYFALPYDQVDLMLQALSAGVEPAVAAKYLGVDVTLVEASFRDLEGKRRGAARSSQDALVIGDRRLEAVQ